jgi:hypothetical protein
LPNTSGVQIDASGTVDTTADIPMYVFQYAVPPQDNSIPIHDHRDNFNGGFAFSVYQPGTSLQRQPWHL